MFKNFKNQPRVYDYEVVSFDYINNRAENVNILYLGTGLSDDDNCTYVLFQTLTPFPELLCVKL